MLSSMSSGCGWCIPELCYYCCYLAFVSATPIDSVDAAATYFVPLFLLFGCVFYTLRFRWIRRRRAGKEPGYFPTYSSAGNAFQELQKLTQPRTEFVLQEKHNQRVDQDDEGDPKTPGAK